MWENAKYEMNENTINNENAYTADTYTKHLTLYCSLEANYAAARETSQNQRENLFIMIFDFAYFFYRIFYTQREFMKFFVNEITTKKIKLRCEKLKLLTHFCESFRVE